MSEILDDFLIDLASVIAVFRICSRNLLKSAHNPDFDISDDLRQLYRDKSKELSQQVSSSLIVFHFLNRNHIKGCIKDTDIQQDYGIIDTDTIRNKRLDDIIIEPLQFRSTLKENLLNSIAIANNDLIDNETGHNFISEKGMNALSLSYHLMDVCYYGAINNMLYHEENAAAFDTAYSIQTVWSEDPPLVENYKSLSNEFNVVQRYFENNKFMSSVGMLENQDKALKHMLMIWAADQYDDKAEKKTRYSIEQYSCPN